MSTAALPEDSSKRRLRFEVERLGALYRLTDAVSRARRVEDVYDVALDCLQRCMGAERSAILVYDGAGVMRFCAWRGLSDAYRSAVEGHSPWPRDVVDPQPVIVADVNADESLAGYRELFARERIGALSFIPICAGGALVGKFMVYFDGPRELGAEALALAMTIAGHVGIGIERMRSARFQEMLLGIIGHDLRGPLTSIRFSATTVAEAPDEERRARGVARILAATTRAERMISDLIDFGLARTGGGLTVSRAPVDLLEIAQKTIDELVTAWPGRNVELSHEGDLRGSYDADRIQQVLANLLDNALQYGPAGEPARIRLQGDARSVTVAVANRGEPIAPDVVRHLFEPYRRFSDPAHARKKSVGLGLYIVGEIVKAHGGEVAASWSEQDGTVFTVQLPR